MPRKLSQKITGSTPGATSDALQRWRTRSTDGVGSVREFAGTTPGSRLGLLALVAVLAGVLLAGVLLPVVGAAGLIAKAGAQQVETLPLEIPTMHAKSTVLAADGSVLAIFYNPRANRVVKPLSEISKAMQEAQIAIEDNRFYQHGGIDLQGTARAFASGSGDDGATQGGSTLTQQLVKNILLEKALDANDAEAAKKAKVRTRDVEGFARKIRELRFAAGVEKKHSKDEILAGYLNIAYYGNGAYGVEAAANRYFSKAAKDLQVHEAALLAGMVKNPSAYDPFKFQQAAKDRRNTVIQRMVETKVLAPELGESFKARNLSLNHNPSQSGCESVDAGFFCDYIRRLITSNPIFGEFKEDRDALLFNGGITVKTTLDPRMQRAAQAGLKARVYPTDPVVATIVSVEPGTGHIKAMAVSRKFGSGPNELKINTAADMEMGASRGIAPGSTFKMFTAAIALEQGYGTEHTIHSPYRISAQNVDRCKGFGEVKGYTNPVPYSPRNELPDEDGPYTMRMALAKSINTYFVQLQSQIDGGICPVAKLVDEMGIKRAVDGQPLEQFIPFTLGFNQVSPISMAGAYATFAARGKFCPPTAITEVLDREGKPLPIPPTTCKQLLRPEVADAINDMQKSVVEFGSGKNSRLDDGREQGGKTGTHERQTVWYIGSVPQLTTAVAVYNPINPIMELRNFKIGGFSPSSTGTWGGFNLPAPLWKAAMDGMVQGLPAEKFVPVDPKLLGGTKGSAAGRDPSELTNATGQPTSGATGGTGGSRTATPAPSSQPTTVRPTTAPTPRATSQTRRGGGQTQRPVRGETSGTGQ